MSVMSFLSQGAGCSTSHVCGVLSVAGCWWTTSHVCDVLSVTGCWWTTSHDCDVLSVTGCWWTTFASGHLCVVCCPRRCASCSHWWGLESLCAPPHPSHTASHPHGLFRQVHTTGQSNDVVVITIKCLCRSTENNNCSNLTSCAQFLVFLNLFSKTCLERLF